MKDIFQEVLKMKKKIVALLASVMMVSAVPAFASPVGHMNSEYAHAQHHSDYSELCCGYGYGRGGGRCYGHCWNYDENE